LTSARDGSHIAPLRAHRRRRDPKTCGKRPASRASLQRARKQHPAYPVWLPALVLAAVFHESVSVLWSNIVSLLGLVGFVIVNWVYCKRAIGWNWVLAGVYIIGPISLMTIAVFTGATPLSERGERLLFDAVVCLLPPMTAWLSLLSGQLFSVLAVTFVLPILQVIRGRYGAGRSTEPPPTATV
jgi:hypothetical protein